MKNRFKYTFLLILLLAVIVNITAGSGRVPIKIRCEHEATQYEFSSQTTSIDDLYGRDVSGSNIVPSIPVRLLPNNNFLSENAHCGVTIPQIYKNVLTFNIDNLSTLGQNQNQYYVFTLHKIRI